MSLMTERDKLHTIKVMMNTTAVVLPLVRGGSGVFRGGLGLLDSNWPPKIKSQTMVDFNLSEVGHI